MFKYAGALSMAAVATATTIDDSVYYTLGQAISALNRGMCESFQYDINDTTTDCYMACDAFSTDVECSFDYSNSACYTDGVWNAADASSWSSILAVGIQYEYQQCNFQNFLMQLNQRFTNWGYFGGVLANIGTSVTIDLVNGTRDSYFLLYWDQFYGSINPDMANMTQAEWEDVARGLIGMVVRAVNYQAPEVQPANEGI